MDNTTFMPTISAFRSEMCFISQGYNIQYYCMYYVCSVIVRSICVIKTDGTISSCYCTMWYTFNNPESLLVCLYYVECTLPALNRALVAGKQDKVIHGTDFLAQLAFSLLKPCSSTLRIRFKKDFGSPKRLS